MITALSIFSFLMLCFNVYLVYDNMHFKIEMRKAYINMEAQRDLITTEMLMSKTKNTKNGMHNTKTEGFTEITNKLGNTALIKKVPEEIAMKYKPKRKEQPEFILQKQVCQWLNTQYPKVMFKSDTVAAVKLTMPQAVRNKSIQKEGFKCPDLLIFEPRGNYHGLFIELKIETPFKKDGDIKASQDDHLLKQYETLLELAKKGYWAEFAWSFDMAVNIIKAYMNQEENY